jgi:hypothetical protein
MAFNIQAQLRVKVGTVAYFNFDDPVLNYMVGMSGFNFERSGNDEHIRDLIIDLQVNQPSPTMVSVLAKGVMVDNGGRGLDANKSYIDVVLLANTKDAQPGLLLSNLNGIPSGQQGTPVNDLPLNPVFKAAVVSGFNMSYGSDVDHHVKDIHVSVGITSTTTSGTSATVTGQATMVDGGGANAVNPTLDAGVIAENGSYQSAGFFSTTAFNSQTGLLTGTLTSRSPSPVFATLVQGFDVSFSGSDHHVLAIELDTSVSATSIASSQESFGVLVSSAISMRDSNGHKSDPTKSWVSGLVICN